jgi:transposase
MAWRKLTQQQWEAIRVHLPPRKTSPRGGRPRVDDRRCLEGILWILWTGCQWSELPRRYGSASTCWRRLKHWEESSILLKLWRAFLAQLNDQQKLRWDECFVDGSFVPAKKGGPSRENETWQGYEVAGFGRWRGYSVGSILGGGVPGGSHPP